MLHGKWWEIYNDAELNALEDKLNIDNQTIKVYFENFMQARAIVAEVRSQLFPTVTLRALVLAIAGLGELRRVEWPEGAGNLTTLPFNASWEPDLWGRIHGQISEAQCERAGERGRPGERETERAGQPGGIFLRDSRTGRIDRGLPADGGGRSEVAGPDPLAV